VALLVKYALILGHLEPLSDSIFFTLQGIEGVAVEIEGFNKNLKLAAIFVHRSVPSSRASQSQVIIKEQVRRSADFEVR
jgi:hypothetical protein